MRPQQQNRRMRGRGGGGNNNNNNNNNNRKGPNPLTRSYESNGPDVKIRGTAQQIAEKYTTLARDAQSSGDRVMAENYLQHAEHYNRIIAAAQAQMPQQQPRDSRDDDLDEDGEDNGFNAGQQNGSNQQNGHRNDQQRQPQQVNGHGPQPVIEGVPAEVAHEQGEIRTERAPRDGGETDSDTSGEGAVQAEAGEQQADGEQPEAAPRKPRRPRRPRNRDDAGQQAAPQEAGSEPVTQD